MLQTTWHIISWGLPVCNPLPENLLRQKSLMNYLGNLLASFWVSKHWWKQFRHLTEPHHMMNSMLTSLRMRRVLRFLCISLHSSKTLSFPFSSIYSIFPTGHFRQKRRWYKTRILLSVSRQLNNTPAFSPTLPPTSFTSCKRSYSFLLKILRKFWKLDGLLGFQLEQNWKTLRCVAMVTKNTFLLACRKLIVGNKIKQI